jgi:hypothetical protein
MGQTFSKKLHPWSSPYRSNIMNTINSAQKVLHIAITGIQYYILYIILAIIQYYILYYIALCNVYSGHIQYTELIIFFSFHKNPACNHHQHLCMYCIVWVILAWFNFVVWASLSVQHLMHKLHATSSCLLGVELIRRELSSSLMSSWLLQSLCVG